MALLFCMTCDKKLEESVVFGLYTKGAKDDVTQLNEEKIKSIK